MVLERAKLWVEEEEAGDDDLRWSAEHRHADEAEREDVDLKRQQQQEQHDV